MSAIPPSSTSESYAALLAELKARVRAARLRAATAVN